METIQRATFGDFEFAYEDHERPEPDDPGIAPDTEQDEIEAGE